MKSFENDRRGRVLIVEDEPIVSMAIRESLASMGYLPCAVVDNGPEAIEQAGNLKPDCVLMDINLVGEMDGIEAAEKIVAIHDIPVIYLTAYADSQTMLRAMNTLPYGYIVKPFKNDQLYSTIERAVHKQRVLKKIKPKGTINRDVDTIPDAVITFNGSLEVEMINNEAKKMIGWSTEEGKGRDIFDFLGIEGDSSDTLKNIIESERSSKSPFPWPVEYGIATKYGDVINVDAMIRLQRYEETPDEEIYLYLRKKDEIVADKPKIHPIIGEDLKRMIDQIPEPAYFINREMKLIGYNMAFGDLAQMMGIKKLDLNKSIYSNNTMTYFGYRYEYEETIRKNRKQNGTIGFQGKEEFYIGSVSHYPLRFDDDLFVLSVIWDFSPQKKHLDHNYPHEKEMEDIAKKILDLESDFKEISSFLKAVESHSMAILEQVVYCKENPGDFGEIEDMVWKETKIINKMRTKLSEMKAKCHSIHRV